MSSFQPFNINPNPNAIPSAPNNGKILVSDDTQPSGFNWTTIDLGDVSDTDTLANLLAKPRNEKAIYWVTDKNSLYYDDGTNLTQVKADLPSLGKGELLTADTTTAQALAAPTEKGKVLVSAPSESLGMKWDNAPSGTENFAGLNGSAKNGINDWVSVDANFALSVNTTDALDGIADFKLTKAAGDQNNKLVEVPFSIPKAALVETISITMDSDLSNAGYNDDDVKLVIETASGIDCPILQDKEGLRERRIYQFHSHHTEKDYKLKLICNSTNADAYDLFLTNIQIARRAVVHGDKQREIETFRFAGNNEGTPIAWQDRINFTQSQGRSGLWDGYTFTADRKMRVTVTVNVKIKAAIDGYAAFANVANAGLYLSHVGAGSNTDIQQLSFSEVINKGQQFFFQHNVTTQIDNNVAWHHMTIVAEHLDTPSDMILSEDHGAREVRVHYRRNDAQTVAINTDIPFSDKRPDTNTDNWKGSYFEAPETGIYTYSGSVRSSNNLNYGLNETVNGSRDQLISLVDVASAYKHFSGTRYLKKGDKFSIRSGLSLDLVDSWNHHIRIHKLATPQTIAQSPTQYFAGRFLVGQSLPSGVTFLSFTKDDDTHNAQNGNEIIIKRDGRALVLSDHLLNNGGVSYHYIFHYNSSGTIINRYEVFKDGGHMKSTVNNKKFNVKKGDKIKFAIECSNQSTHGSNQYQRFSVEVKDS